MSKFVKIRTQLRDLNLVKRALEDLKLEFKEDAAFVHIYSARRVPAAVVVRAQGVQFGLAEADGQFEVLADDMQSQTIRAVMEKVTQRYAYHKVLEETAQAGFNLVEESVGADKVIRLVVRRYSEGA